MGFLFSKPLPCEDCEPSRQDLNRCRAAGVEQQTASAEALKALSDRQAEVADLTARLTQQTAALSRRQDELTAAANECRVRLSAQRADQERGEKFIASATLLVEILLLQDNALMDCVLLRDPDTFTYWCATPDLTQVRLHKFPAQPTVTDLASMRAIGLELEGPETNGFLLRVHLPVNGVMVAMDNFLGVDALGNVKLAKRSVPIHFHWMSLFHGLDALSLWPEGL